MSLRDVLKKIQEELVERDEVRQQIQASARRAARLSKRAIFLIHKAKLEEAEDALREVKKIFTSLSNLATVESDLLRMGTVDSAFQEYVEAYIFLKLVKEGRFVNLEEVNVPVTSYVLGLADVIGEFRRRALDSLREGESRKAEECLELMEDIYMELINLEEIHYLIPGLRRKCDVARRLIEATRGDITIDARRNSLENSMKELKETLETLLHQK